MATLLPDFMAFSTASGGSGSRSTRRCQLRRLALVAFLEMTRWPRGRRPRWSICRPACVPRRNWPARTLGHATGALDVLFIISSTTRDRRRAAPPAARPPRPWRRKPAVGRPIWRSSSAAVPARRRLFTWRTGQRSPTLFAPPGLLELVVPAPISRDNSTAMFGGRLLRRLLFHLRPPTRCPAHRPKHQRAAGLRPPASASSCHQPGRLVGGGVRRAADEPGGADHRPAPTARTGHQGQARLRRRCDLVDAASRARLFLPVGLALANPASVGTGTGRCTGATKAPVAARPPPELRAGQSWAAPPPPDGHGARRAG